MRPRLPLLMVVLATFCVAGPAHARARADKLPPSTRLVLENGFEAILIPNHAAPLVTSVVVVRTGSLRETPDTSGISHMLEHLLFNGTARRTQEQIYDEQDRYGIINNAQTAATHTAFFVMSTREQCHRALDLQADMLFGSTIPEDKLAKERDIIANEIARDQVRDAALMSDLYNARLYSPGAAALPVLGTPNSIRAIGRDAILAYYHAWYVPNNMTAVIMGDFEPAEMEPLVSRMFGRAAPALLPPPPGGSVNAGALGRRHTARTTGASRMLWLGAAAPGMEHDSYAAAHMLASLLGEDLAQAANARLSAAGVPGSILGAEVGWDGFGSFGSFQVRSTLDETVGWSGASSALLEEITGRLAGVAWKSADLARLRLSEKAQAMRLWEKPHYFGLARAPFIAAGGWDLARDFGRRLRFVETADLKDIARKLSSAEAWAVFAAGPDAPADQGIAATPRQDEGEFAGQPTADSRRLTARWKGRRPAAAGDADRGAEAMKPRAPSAASGITVRLTLENGLLVSLDVSNDSRIFAAHALIRNRSAAEPPGKEGIAELLHRLAGAGTRSHPGTTFDERLASIGGTLKVSDDPSIPYDDIYLSPEYSYIRLEALDEFADEAIGLLAEILSEPDLPDRDDAPGLASAREALALSARQALASPRDRGRLLLARGLWGEGHPFSRPLFGTERSVRSITADDLASFHRSYFSPRNIIVGIATSVRAERLLPVISSRLGRWGLENPVGPPSPAPPPTGPSDTAGAGPHTLNETLDSSQAYIRWGRLVDADPNGAAALTAAAAVLSRRMGDTLREQRGLSYSLGAEAAPTAGRIALQTWMGIVPSSLAEARAGMKEMILSMATRSPTQQEVDDAIRATEVRTLMRGLSRINQAYGRCIEQMRQGTAPEAQRRSGAPVTAAAVLGVVRSLIDPGALGPWVEAVIGPESGQ